MKSAALVLDASTGHSFGVLWFAKSTKGGRGRRYLSASTSSAKVVRDEKARQTIHRTARHERLPAHAGGLEQGQQTDLGIAYHMAFQSLRTCGGQEADAHTLACTLNIALALAERGYGAEWVERVKAAQDGLMRCLGRGKKTGSWGLDGPAMIALSEALALHDEQIALATQREIRDAIAEVHRRITNGDTLELETA